MPQALRRSLSVATATAVAASALVALGGAGVANAATYPTINEFSFDTSPNADVEFFEIHAAPGTSLAGHTLLGIEGDSNGIGVLDNRIELGAVTTDANGLHARSVAANTFENGALSLLLVTGTVPAAGTDLDANDDGVLDAGLGFTIVDSIAVTDAGAGVTYGGVTLSRDTDGFGQDFGGASRIPDGTDTDTTADWVRNDFNVGDATVPAGQAFNTAGLPNAVNVVAPPAVECDAEGVTLVSAVQGSGASSPLVGTTVEVQGVVTAVFPGLAGATGTSTFAVQEEAADQDADPATSEGILAEIPSTLLGALAVGQEVRVVGAVSEEFGRTHLDAGAYDLCAESATLPEATVVSLPLANAEATEGMLVTMPQSLSVLETFQFAQYGEIVLGTERQFQPTALAAPGSDEAIAIAAANAANRITLDDGRTQQNADPAIHPNGQPFTLDNLFRGGDTVANVTGILDYGFSKWRIQPTEGADHTAANPRPEVPAVGGDLQVASFNVLNYFTTLGSRGADDAVEFERQEAKIVAAILELDADVVGLLEIENNDGVALDTLVAALNEAAGEARYAAVDTGTLGTDEITTALIYQPAAVTPSGAFAVLDASVDPRFDTTRNRPSLIQTFEANDSGAQLTISVNHLKSKGSACSGDPDLGDGAGNCNGTRTQAAEALADFLATDPTGAGTDDVLILGDLNSYDHEDPIVALETAGYLDQLEAFQGEEAYTYVFDGQLGYLDYALASPSLASQVVDAAAWTANSDEVPILDYDTTFKQPAQDAIYAPDPYRASDHDAVLVGLSLETPVEPEVDVTTFAGTDRYDTNVQVSEALFDEGTNVFLASGAGFVDALAAGPAAAAEDASLLLTPSDRLLDVTIGELERLAPETITIVGGEPSVSAAVEADLARLLPGATIERIAGADRFETAALLALESFGSADGAFLASGVSFPDALSASGVAAQRGDVPVLLTRPDVLPEVTASALDELGVVDVAVLGSRVTVSDAVVRQARELGDVVRVAGADRYATNALMVQTFALPTADQPIAIASGANFPDALSATAVAGQLGAPVLLATGGCVLLDTEDVIAAIDPQLVVNVGGRPTLDADAWRTSC